MAMVVVTDATPVASTGPVRVEAESFGDAHRAAFGAALRERVDLEAVMAGLTEAAPANWGPR
jgi:hypothetical protein